MSLTHIDEKGNARMVDVGEKAYTLRTAIAQAVVIMHPQTLKLITSGEIKKGDVLSCARIAGIMAAKKTSDLIPMCHPLPIDSVSIELSPSGENRIYIRATVKCTYKTGIEMEALTAASVAALTIYDMCKAVDRSMEIAHIALLHKEGGKSGIYNRIEVCGISLSVEKGVRKHLEVANFIKDIGVEGDRFSGDTARQISLMSYDFYMSTKHAGGLCTNRFHPNILTKGLDYSAIEVGSVLLIGDAKIKITKIGKDCHNDCPLYNSTPCILPENCAFAAVEQSGEVAIFDAIYNE